MSDVTRRAALVGGAGSVCALFLAGCGGSSGSNDPATTTPADTSPAGPTTAGTTTGATSSAASSTPATSASSASGTELATLADIDVGSAVAVKLADGNDGIVTRTGTDTAVAFNAACTHMGRSVIPESGRLHCTWHGSNFDLKTGDVLNGPASSPLAKVDVTVSGGKVLET